MRERGTHRSIALGCLAALVAATGCKSVYWLPEDQVTGLKSWEAGDEREVVTTSGRRVDLDERTVIVLERDDGDPDTDDSREVARFERIDVTDLGLSGRRAAPALGEVFIPAEELGRVGVRATNWRKTIGLSVGLPLGVALVLFIAAVIAASRCESCEGDSFDWD